MKLHKTTESRLFQFILKHKKKVYGFFHLIFPYYFSQQIGFELRIFKGRLSSKKTRKKAQMLQDFLLNIGAGDTGRKDWINVDVGYFPGINIVWDCRKSLPFKDESAKGIFSEHFFEHLDYYEETPVLFKEIYRVLQPGSVVRIIVPDAQKYLEAYNQVGWNAIAKVRPLTDAHIDVHTKELMHTKMELINWIFRQNYEHKFAYDFETLEYQLRKAGFTKIIHQKFNQSLQKILLLDIAARESESLYIEAVK